MNDKLPQSDSALLDATGKDWAGWFAILENWGASERSHTEIARYLSGDHGVPGWWAQGITVGFERTIGRREVGQRNDGSYSSSASKTIKAPMTVVHNALVDDTARGQWLGDGALTLRTQQTKSARFDESESGLIVAFFLTDKGDKTALQAQVDNVPTAEVSAAWKAIWKDRLTALANYLAESEG